MLIYQLSLNMKTGLLLSFLLACVLQSSCQMAIDVVEHEQFTQTTYRNQGAYPDSVTLSFWGYSEKAQRDYPLLIEVNGHAYLPDSLGVRTIFETPGRLSIRLMSGLFQELIIKEFEAHAGDSIYFEVELLPVKGSISH